MRPNMQNQNANNDLVIDDDGEIVNQDYQNNSNENEQLDSQQENLNEIEDDEEEDDRLTYTLITLDLGNLIHIFEENNISFIDMLLLTKDDLKELQLELYQRNRIFNFSALFNKYAKNYSIGEISDFFSFNKQFIFNSSIYDKVTNNNQGVGFPAEEGGFVYTDGGVNMLGGDLGGDENYYYGEQVYNNTDNDVIIGNNLVNYNRNIPNNSNLMINRKQKNNDNIQNQNINQQYYTNNIYSNGAVNMDYNNINNMNNIINTNNVVNKRVMPNVNNNINNNGNNSCLIKNNPNNKNINVNKQNNNLSKEKI